MRYNVLHVQWGDLVPQKDLLRQKLARNALLVPMVHPQVFKLSLNVQIVQWERMVAKEALPCLLSVRNVQWVDMVRLQASPALISAFSAIRVVMVVEQGTPLKVNALNAHQEHLEL